MREAGYVFEVVAPEADEVMDAADPAGTVARNAAAKHDACRALRPDAAVLAADTLVWFDGRLVGKPRDADEAAAFLRAFSGRPQTVFTAVAFSRPGESRPQVRIEASVVCFRKLSEAMVEEYVRLVRPFDRAGAYDVDEHGDMLVEEIVGSFTNVVGLPMEVVRELLGEDWK